ncbi:MAG: LacI family DNA-binding transcriptional regulator [Anaerolineales bacterium]|nr:LacI family DNA-binding transcriptional regulator [Anaerolineales bacterium]
MPVTIKDIARRARVAHSTVSRALRDDSSIPAHTAERIKRLATRMGYIPSAAARSLKTTQSRALGVVVTNIADPFLSEVVRGIEEAVREAGYSLFLAAAYRDRERERLVLRSLAERRIDGAIICSSQILPADLAELEKFGVPLVLINNQAPERFAHSIAHDDVAGGRAVTRHLLALGHRRVAYLGTPVGGQASLDRQAGYEAEMAAHGLAVKPGWLLAGPDSRPAGGQAGIGLALALAPRPTAVFCFNDMMALGVLQRARQAGLRVPADLSVAGFDDVFVAEYAEPPLTTFAQPKHRLGQDAARLMLDLLQGPRPKQPIVKTIRGELLVRASTGPPPRV